MNRSMIVLFFVAFWIGNCQAQSPRDFPTDCTLPQLMMRNSGDLVRIKCDSVWILSNLRFKGLVGENMKLDSLLKLYKTLYQEDEQVIKLKDRVIARMDSISMIQDRAFSSLSLQWSITDSIAKASFENTKDAIRYARAIKIGSYVASGLSGGIVTGLATGTKDQPFRLGYAAAGVLIGVGINYLILDVIL